MLEGSALGIPLGTPVGLVLGYDIGIILRLTDNEILGTIIVAADVITLKLVEGTELGSLDGSLDGSNDGIPEGSLLAQSL